MRVGDKKVSLALLKNHNFNGLIDVIEWKMSLSMDTWWHFAVNSQTNVQHMATKLCLRWMLILNTFSYASSSFPRCFSNKRINFSRKLTYFPSSFSFIFLSTKRDYGVFLVALLKLMLSVYFGQGINQKTFRQMERIFRMLIPLEGCLVWVA